MYLESLSLTHFRNYDSASIRFSDNINLVHGLNAQGKTNLLEAIYLICLGRSFRTATNQDLLKNDADFFTVKGAIRLGNGIRKAVILHYIKDGKKEISVDGKRLQSHARLFGQFPIVVMSPDDYRITSGSPSERRKFLDILLSQVNISYLTSLQDYTRILKQRNRILQGTREGLPIDRTAMAAWTEGLIRFGSRIIEERKQMLKRFLVMTQEIYSRYTESDDELNLGIDSTIDLQQGGATEEKFEQALSYYERRESALGVTLVGPHRDDLVISINGKDLKKYGSRGEHKSALISLKIAEFDFLKQRINETPVFLLDDYYSELDDEREERVFFSLQDLGQTFLTTPKERVFDRELGRDLHSQNYSKLYVKNGFIEVRN